MQGLITLFYVALTVGSYVVFRNLYMRYRHPLLNVVVLAAAVVVLALLSMDLTYEDYIPAKDIMTILLGPATVGLAVPLYRNRGLLAEYGLAIVSSVAAGSVLAMGIAGGIAKAWGLPWELVVSILPKGVSIPFAVEVSAMYGGIPAMSIAFVVATGTLAGLMGPQFLNWVGIKNPVARGLSLGTVSHAQGTAMAFLEGERQGSMSGLALILAGIFTSILAPLMVWLLSVL